MISIAIVRSFFNNPITSKMERAAVKCAKKNHAHVIVVHHVPGAFDMPLALKKALQNPRVDCVVALGAIIKGETKHDETISFSLSKTIHELELQYNKPIGFGVMGPGIDWEQAEERAEDYADRAVKAAVALFKLQNSKNKP